MCSSDLIVTAPIPCRKMPRQPISRTIRRLGSGWCDWRDLGVEIPHAHRQAFGPPRAGDGVEDAGARRAALLARARLAQSPIGERVAVAADQESIAIVAICASPAAIADRIELGWAHAVPARRAARRAARRNGVRPA